MAEFKAIKIVAGDGGWGGPLVVKATPKRNKVMYIVGGGAEPECLSRIVELSGMTPVNGFKTSCPEEEIAMVVIDCGGTLRCGIYPQKGIPTANVMPTGKSGPLAQYIKEDIYVSSVKSSCISLADGSEAVSGSYATAEGTATAATSEAKDSGADFGVSGKDKDYMASTPQKKSSLLSAIGMGVGTFVNTLYQAGRDAIQTCITTLLPFMAFVAMLIGVINGTGLGNLIANFLSPLAGNPVGLLVLGIVVSIPGLSALLGPGAVIAQIIGTLIGAEIGKGAIAPQMALPALFAINNQCACDFVPVGLGLAEAETETIEVGVLSVMYSRFLTGWVRVLLAFAASVGLYA